jgi:hypothetical protein
MGRPVMTRDKAGTGARRERFDEAPEIQDLKDFHVGLSRETCEDVARIQAELIVDEIGVDMPQQRHDRWGLGPTAPGGLVTEVASLECRAWAS